MEFLFCYILLLFVILTDFICITAAPKKENDWGGGSNWGNDPRSTGGAGMDPRDMRAGASGMVDPRDHMRTVIDQRLVLSLIT